MKRSRDTLIGDVVDSGKARVRMKRRRIRSSSVQARLTAWAYYSSLIGGWKDSRKALKEALRKALPVDQHGEIDSRKEFDRWDKHDLWPPPELEDTPYGEIPLFQDTTEKYRAEES
jgi:hypothetical protein